MSLAPLPLSADLPGSGWPPGLYPPPLTPHGFAGVSGSAGMALGRLAMRGGAAKLVERAAEMLTDLATCITTASIRQGLPDRISLYKIVVSVLKEAGGGPQPVISRQLADRVAALCVGDLTAINIAMLAAESGAQGGAEWELQKHASRAVVCVAELHPEAAIRALLPKLETATMQQQQQAQRKIAGQATPKPPTPLPSSASLSRHRPRRASYRELMMPPKHCALAANPTPSVQASPPQRCRNANT